MSLITLERASLLFPQFNSDDEGILQLCIDAAESVIEEFCNRRFELRMYDDLYDGPGGSSLLTDQFPIVAIHRISHSPFNIMHLRNTLSTVSRASFRLDGTTDIPPQPNNLYLQSVVNGVETVITIGPLTGSPTVDVDGVITSIAPQNTMGQLAATINLFGTSRGWVAEALGIYGTWPVMDLRPPQGSFECRFLGNAYLKQFIWNQPAFEYNPEIGEIVSPTGFQLGYRNYRVIYEAGYEVVPEGIQQACAALAVSVLQGRGLNTNIQSESLGSYSYTLAARKTFEQLDIVARYGLALFRNRRIPRFKVTV